ncbi:MAG TPA: helix-turn-helix transcriptional regulator [Methylomirabilota bacterium]|nr:helix-turn-helix transcriptional regulator [Methylomirabilota bacterium]
MKSDETADIFRERLGHVIARSGLNPSAFARGAGIDRSTLAQLLDDRIDRLPRAETLVAVATHAHVSVDWLLGLSQSEQIGAEIIEAALQFERTATSPIDDQFLEWLKDAVGVRIKTVPATFPDFLKSEAVLRFEYQDALVGDIDARIQFARTRLDFWRQPDTELETAFPLQQLDLLAKGAGRWSGMPVQERRQGLEHLRDVYDQLYPGIRAYLFDQRRTTSAPFTVFGTRRAAIYLGERYLVMNAIGHIRLLSQRFDELIRAASVLPHAVPEHVDALLTDMAD